MASFPLSSYGLACLSLLVMSCECAPPSPLNLTAGPSTRIPNSLTRRALGVEGVNRDHPGLFRVTNFDQLSNANNFQPPAELRRIGSWVKPMSNTRTPGPIPGRPAPLEATLSSLKGKSYLTEHKEQEPFSSENRIYTSQSPLNEARSLEASEPSGASLKTLQEAPGAITDDQKQKFWWKKHIDQWHEQDLDTWFLIQVGDILAMDELEPKFNWKLKADELIQFLSSYRVMPPGQRPVWRYCREREALNEVYRTGEGWTADYRISKILAACDRLEFDKNHIPVVGSSANDQASRLSWLFEGLDPEEMIKYAEALRGVHSGDLQEILIYQPILERSDIRDEDKKYSVPRWYSEKMGWEHFKNCLMASEVKMPSHRVLRKAQSYRLMRTSSLSKGSPKQTHPLQNGKGHALMDEGVSKELSSWLSNFRKWLDRDLPPLHSRVGAKQLKGLSRIYSS